MGFRNHVDFQLMVLEPVVASGPAGTFTACILDDCYTFNMYDSFGDGWNGGIYTITDNNTATVYGTGGLTSGASVT